jgi:hypothetical protein
MVSVCICGSNSCFRCVPVSTSSRSGNQRVDRIRNALALTTSWNVVRSNSRFGCDAFLRRHPARLGIDFGASLLVRGALGRVRQASQHGFHGMILCRRQLETTVVPAPRWAANRILPRSARRTTKAHEEQNFRPLRARIGHTVPRGGPDCTKISAVRPGCLLREPCGSCAFRVEGLLTLLAMDQAGACPCQGFVLTGLPARRLVSEGGPTSGSTRIHPPAGSGLSLSGCMLFALSKENDYRTTRPVNADTQSAR